MISQKMVRMQIPFINHDCHFALLVMKSTTINHDWSHRPPACKSFRPGLIVEKPMVTNGSPLLNIQKAIENGH